MKETATHTPPEERWTNGKRWVATAKQVGMKWGSGFQCGICDSKFKAGDGARWVYMADRACLNFLVCDYCDRPNVQDKWAKATRLANAKENDRMRLALLLMDADEESEACHRILDRYLGLSEEETSVELFSVRLKQYFDSLVPVITDADVNGDD